MYLVGVWGQRCRLAILLWEHPGRWKRGGHGGGSQMDGGLWTHTIQFKECIDLEFGVCALDLKSDLHSFFTI